MVVVETVTGADGKRMYRANSTVSRYACRIQCERSPPYSARLFAAAFDTSGKIKLSVRESHTQYMGDVNNSHVPELLCTLSIRGEEIIQI